ncbi:MAG: DUF5722 domain-containing protein [Christensenellales bacterium]|nr:DUF5722 domain-containing protein [Christensenellales bacterium]
MKITSITANLESILVFIENPVTEVVQIDELAPLYGPEQILLSSHLCPIQNNIAILPRMDGDHDRLYSAFRLGRGSSERSVVHYVTDIAQEVVGNNTPYPQPKTIKALYGTSEDIQSLGLHQTPCNINLPTLMTLNPSADDIAFPHDGKTYYFLRGAVEALDNTLRNAARQGVLVTMILLNSPRLFGSTGEQALLNTCTHPCFDWNSEEAFISAFNMRTSEGQGLYRAFVEFLAERYTRPDGKYGRVAGAIISNEVNSQYIWGNAGEMDVADYAAEYALALRLAWLCGRKHCAHFRVYLSLDQHWCHDVHNPLYPLRYYPGRTLIEHLASHIQETGDFPWCVAYHPYPEDLRWPDFWHDRAPDFTFSTPKITFKNIEVLEAYLSQPHMRYRSMPRRIIFSEQGFNTQDGPLQSLTERMGEAGYVLAYLKARKMDTVDMMMHHAYVDNPREFGLNLGIRRYDPEAPHHAGEKKPIYDAIRDMETSEEPRRIKKARAFIGEALFDYLLNPPLTYGDRDTSRDNEFF